MKAIKLALAGLLACGGDTLTTEYPEIEVVPLPHGTQTALEAPVGIDLGDVPVFGFATASFRIDNPSRREDLTVRSVELVESQGGVFSITRAPEKVRAGGDELLTVQYTPATIGAQGSATLRIDSDAGPRGRTRTEVRVLGAGISNGEPHLLVCYSGDCHAVPEDCDTSAGGCALPTLDFGNVQLGSTATQIVRLQNLPAAGTCATPPGEPPCTPMCVLTFARNTSGFDLGVGVAAPANGFGLEGNATPPLYLGTPDPACDGSVESGEVVRRDLPLLVGFAAGEVEALDLESQLVLETNQPGISAVTVPLRASARVAPVAVARLRTCDAQNLPPSCTDAADIAPLQRVYFDGRDSYDPANAAPDAIADYRWRVVAFPPGAPTAMFDPQGDGTPLASMFVPIAGEYVMRLTVTNGIGLDSGVSDTSDVVFTAIPDSRVHVQLVWDNPLNDLDLHLVDANIKDHIYSTADCHWNNCRPTCSPDDGCTPVHWFTAEPVFQSSNPRLDIDDTEGLGPENINIDRPAAAVYRIYVHYYGLLDPTDVPTVATVRIYLDGVPRAELRRTLGRNDLWRVAEIEWMSDATSVVRPATSDAQGEVGAVKQFDYQNYPTGYAFGGAF